MRTTTLAALALTALTLGFITGRVYERFQSVGPLPNQPTWSGQRGPAAC